MLNTIINSILGMHMLLCTSLAVQQRGIFYQYRSAQMEVAQHPLSIRAVDISLTLRKMLRGCDKENFFDIWAMRRFVDSSLAKEGYTNRLCYAKLEADQSPVWQVTAYPNLPAWANYWVIKKIYSVFQQTKVLFRTFFPATKLSDTAFEKERIFWSLQECELQSTNGQYHGKGALTQKEVIDKQIIYPNVLTSEESEILLLYNYAPLRTGGEQMHFLLIPNPSHPAEHFLELNSEQYTQVLALAKKVTLWANETFQGQVVVHFFDKTGEMAGQTQPLYHAHLIIVKKGEEELWGRLAMFFRMFFPPSPLASDELEKRVTHYRDTLGKSIRS